MLFGNPVKQAVIRPPGSPAISGNFRVTQDFGPTSLSAEPSITWPGGEGISAGFHAHFHKALDLGNRQCGAEVRAAAKGIVRKAGKLNDGNIHVILDHGDGWASAYLHLASEDVAVGQAVAKGAKLGVVGTTGNSTACHLHFAIKSGVDFGLSFFSNANGKWRDPWPRLEQNVTIAIKADGINIRVDPGSAATPAGEIFASSKPDGTLRRKSDNADLGPFSQRRAWGGTVKGSTYTVLGVTGSTWEKINLEGVFHFVATPLAALSAT